MKAKRILMYLVCFFVVIVVIGCTPYSAEVQFDEAYPCTGPDENGEPTGKETTFSGKNLAEIYVCGYVQTSEPIWLSAYWIPGDESRSFVFNREIEVEQSGYVYFSLVDAIQHTEQLPFGGNYYSHYTDEGVIPVGEYQVVIEQGRRTITTVTFTVE
ncbi:MAG: hypothetical protein JXB38_17750 [Anaerolineales bacterium]|nr:hypothetical protein [Anaerolineales bacterium]